ncbi:hypothetical protein [Actinoallomurus sp. NPDC052274]|uniref:hypothetical protein n=1 Tax=Actinoallomurus sp. NPDC052274 TaxID=3155420 RepID=UPI0034226D5D
MVKWLKLRRLQRHGVEGEAVSTLQEWIRGGHRVYYDVRLDEGSPRASFIEVGPEPRGPVGTVVPVVYDRRKPKRAQTGTLEDIDLTEEWFYVKLFWGPGLMCIFVGTVLELVFS